MEGDNEGRKKGRRKAGRREKTGRKEEGRNGGMYTCILSHFPRSRVRDSASAVGGQAYGTAALAFFHILTPILKTPRQATCPRHVYW